MAPTMPDPAAILPGIREGAESEITHPDDECGIEAGGSCTPHAALLLAAAVGAALKQHRKRDEPVKTHHVCQVHAWLNHPSPEWRADVDACPDCTVTEKYVCAEPSCRHECPDDDEWPCPTFRVIAGELTGAQLGDDDAPADSEGSE